MSSQTDEQLLLRNDDDGIVTLTLNRPGQYNTLSEEMLEALQGALDQLADEAHVRVIVVTGSGKAFCAGHDLKQMQAHPDKAYYQALFSRAGRLMTTLTKQPQPVIARVQGVAAAAGCQLVAACDLAVAATTARFATSGINVGLFCSTPSVALARNVGRKRAMERTTTPRQPMPQPIRTDFKRMATTHLTGDGSRRDRRRYRPPAPC